MSEQHTIHKRVQQQQTAMTVEVQVRQFLPLFTPAIAEQTISKWLIELFNVW